MSFNLPEKCIFCRGTGLDGGGGYCRCPVGRPLERTAIERRIRRMWLDLVIVVLGVACVIGCVVANVDRWLIAALAMTIGETLGRAHHEVQSAKKDLEP